jgi:hypothetical protein
MTEGIRPFYCTQAHATELHRQLQSDARRLDFDVNKPGLGQQEEGGQESSCVCVANNRGVDGKRPVDELFEKVQISNFALCRALMEEAFITANCSLQCMIKRGHGRARLLEISGFSDACSWT